MIVRATSKCIIFAQRVEAEDSTIQRFIIIME